MTGVCLAGVCLEESESMKGTELQEGDMYEKICPRMADYEFDIRKLMIITSYISLFCYELGFFFFLLRITIYL